MSFSCTVSTIYIPLSCRFFPKSFNFLANFPTIYLYLRWRLLPQAPHCTPLCLWQRSHAQSASSSDTTTYILAVTRVQSASPPRVWRHRHRLLTTVLYRPPWASALPPPIARWFLYWKTSYLILQTHVLVWVSWMYWFRIECGVQFAQWWLI
jgi:hypothetical protein